MIYSRLNENTYILTWVPPINQPSPVFSYNVVVWEELYVNTQLNVLQKQTICILSPSTTHTFTVTGLNGLGYGKRHFIQVSARSSNGMTSPFSNKIYINT